MLDLPISCTYHLIKKNIPDLAASLVRTPATHQVSYAAFPLADERPTGERPSWEPSTRFELERDILEMRTTNKRLGRSVNWIVDVLLQDEGSSEDTEHVKSIQNRKREALECLAYVRDILNGNVVDIEEDRLIGVEEAKRRERNMNEAVGTIIRGGVNIDTPKPIPQAATTESGSKNNMGQGSSHASLGQFSGRSRSPTKSPTLTSSRNRPIRTPSSPPLSSPSPPTSIATPNGTRLPPWNYTRSNFGTSSTPLSASLPQLPPPTSATVRPPRLASPTRTYQTQSSEYPPPAPPGQDMNPSRRRASYQRDPLGVMK
jgi:TBC1 domain family protein 5